MTKTFHPQNCRRIILLHYYGLIFGKLCVAVFVLYICVGSYWTQENFSCHECVYSTFFSRSSWISFTVSFLLQLCSYKRLLIRERDIHYSITSCFHAHASACIASLHSIDSSATRPACRHPCVGATCGADCLCPT